MTTVFPSSGIGSDFGDVRVGRNQLGQSALITWSNASGTYSADAQNVIASNYVILNTGTLPFSFQLPTGKLGCSVRVSNRSDSLGGFGVQSALGTVLTFLEPGQNYVGTTLDAGAQDWVSQALAPLQEWTQTVVGGAYGTIAGNSIICGRNCTPNNAGQDAYLFGDNINPLSVSTNTTIAVGRNIGTTSTSSLRSVFLGTDIAQTSSIDNVLVGFNAPRPLLTSNNNNVVIGSGGASLTTMTGNIVVTPVAGETLPGVTTLNNSLILNTKGNSSATAVTNNQVKLTTTNATCADEGVFISSGSGNVNIGTAQGCVFIGSTGSGAITISQPAASVLFAGTTPAAGLLGTINSFIIGPPFGNNVYVSAVQTSTPGVTRRPLFIDANNRINTVSAAGNDSVFSATVTSNGAGTWTLSIGSLGITSANNYRVTATARPATGAFRCATVTNKTTTTITGQTWDRVLAVVAAQTMTLSGSVVVDVVVVF